MPKMFSCHLPITKVQKYSKQLVLIKKTLLKLKEHWKTQSLTKQQLCGKFHVPFCQLCHFIVSSGGLLQMCCFQITTLVHLSLVLH